jgi:hypothetical protein
VGFNQIIGASVSRNAFSPLPAALKVKIRTPELSTNGAA